VLLPFAGTSPRINAGVLLPAAELFPLVRDAALLFAQILVLAAAIESPLVRVSFALLADAAPLPV